MGNVYICMSINILIRQTGSHRFKIDKTVYAVETILSQYQNENHIQIVT